MTEKLYERVRLNHHQDTHVFNGNTVIENFIPDNTTIIVKGGSLVIAGQMGRDVCLLTRHSCPPLQRAAAVITGHQAHLPTEPSFSLRHRALNLTVKPLDIVILSAPQIFSETDSVFKLPANYPLCTLRSGGDVFFLRDTPARTTANVDGTFICYGSLGKLSCINSDKGAFAETIGDLCTVTTSGGISAGSVGICTAFSCAKNLQLGPSKKTIKWDECAATVGGIVEVFGKLSSTDGINARIVTHEKGTYSPYKRQVVSGPLPLVEEMIVG